MLGFLTQSPVVFVSVSDFIFADNFPIRIFHVGIFLAGIFLVDNFPVGIFLVGIFVVSAWTATNKVCVLYAP